MPKVTILVGLPASGKSTWVAANAAGAHIYSTDDVVEELAALGKTYEEVWADSIKEATKIANARLADAIKAKKNIVSDRTNLTVNARAKFLAQFPKSYKREAVLFEAPRSLDQHLARIAARPGKNIPTNILMSMLKDLEGPTLKEGFESVKFIGSWD